MQGVKSSPEAAISLSDKVSLNTVPEFLLLGRLLPRSRCAEEGVGFAGVGYLLTLASSGSTAAVDGDTAPSTDLWRFQLSTSGCETNSTEAAAHTSYRCVFLATWSRRNASRQCGPPIASWMENNTFSLALLS